MDLTVTNRNATSNLSGIFVPHTVTRRRSESNSDNTEAIWERVKRIKQSQEKYDELFSDLSTTIGQLSQKYSMPIFDDDDSTSNPSSAASVSSGNYDVNAQQNFSQQQGYDESALGLEVENQELQDEYPKFIASDPPVMVLGPNGTKISGHFYEEVSWESAAVATRGLLMFIFSSDTLATHTLTGKPSPAFYGRERPIKNQLDPLKVADIIHCVCAKIGGSEREVRAAITTKCADTAKKYKRRMLKKLSLQQQTL